MHIVVNPDPDRLSAKTATARLAWPWKVPGPLTALVLLAGCARSAPDDGSPLVSGLAAAVVARDSQALADLCDRHRSDPVFAARLACSMSVLIVQITTQEGDPLVRDIYRLASDHLHPETFRVFGSALLSIWPLLREGSEAQPPWAREFSSWFLADIAYRMRHPGFLVAIIDWMREADIVRDEISVSLSFVWLVWALTQTGDTVRARKEIDRALLEYPSATWLRERMLLLRQRLDRGGRSVQDPVPVPWPEREARSP